MISTVLNDFYREIAYVRELAKDNSNLCWYYLGFYIHSCPKMSYKGQYKPSFLLCPESYRFQPIQQSIIKLNVDKYSRLDEQTNVQPPKPETHKVKKHFNRLFDFVIELYICLATGDGFVSKTNDDIGQIRFDQTNRYRWKKTDWGIRRIGWTRLCQSITPLQELNFYFFVWNEWIATCI